MLVVLGGLGQLVKQCCNLGLLAFSGLEVPLDTCKSLLKRLDCVVTLGHGFFEPVNLCLSFLESLCQLLDFAAGILLADFYLLLLQCRLERDNNRIAKQAYKLEDQIREKKRDWRRRPLRELVFKVGGELPLLLKLDFQTSNGFLLIFQVVFKLGRLGPDILIALGGLSLKGLNMRRNLRTKPLFLPL